MLPRLTVLPFLLLTLLTGGVADAAPDELATAIPISPPGHRPVTLGADAPPPLAAQPNILFVNFDGGEMNDCGFSNDPHDNCSWIFDGTVLPFSGDASRRAAVVQLIRKDFSDFNIKVTDIRPPANVDYDMEMVGDWDPAPGGGFAGIAPTIDCFNQNGGETSFTLDYTSSPGGIERAILQEVAHTWGLEHVESKSDLLYPTTAGVSDPSFVDECFQIVVLNDNSQTEPSNGECGSQHSQFCGSSDQQNSYRELLELFGPHEPDLTAPTLSITEPAEGAEIEGAFDLHIVAADENSPQALALTIVGEGPNAFEVPQAYYPSPSDLKFPLKGLAPGAYTIAVTVVDEEGNQTEDAVAFTVVGPPAPTTAGEESSAGETTGDTPTTGEPDATGEPATTADTAPDPTADPNLTTGLTDASDSEAMTDGDDGCGCRHGSPGALALLAPLALGLRRRKRA
jgi:hypothetical protein